MIQWPGSGAGRGCAAQERGFPFARSGAGVQRDPDSQVITEGKQTAEALRQRMEELVTLNAVSRAVNATLSLEETMAAALEGMLNAIRPSLAFLFLREGDERLILKEVRPPSARARLSAIPEHRVGQCMCGLAVSQKKALYSRDIFQDHRCTWDECKKAGMRSFAALPLRDGEEVFGVIGLASDTTRDFAQQDEFLETLTTQVSSAFVHARLFVTLQRELAERRGAEDALRAREEQLLMLVKHAPAAIAMLDLDMRYVAVSDRFLADYRLGQRNIIGMCHYDVFPEIRQMEDWLDIHRRCLAGASESREEDPFLRSDGGLDWVKWELVPWRKPDNSIGGIVMFTEVITERKRAQEELKALNATLEQRVAERTTELEQRAAQLSRLTSELALTEHRERERLAQLLHDHLQQLLVGAKLGLEVLAHRVGAAHRDGVEHVRGLLDESIEASRTLTAELSPPILREAGLPAGLEWLARWMAQKHGLTVELNVDPKAQPQREDLRVLLFESVRELLFNVIKHAGVKVARVEMASRKDHLRLTVSDDGAGFSRPEVLRPDGSPLAGGFGLWSIRERVLLLGGSLDVETSPGQGTRITLVAPIRTAVPAAVAPAEQPSAEKVRILLVDDHTVMREGLSQLLGAQEDLAVIGQASDGEEAVELARQLRPQVILMDSSMPRMDGVEATRIIHAEQPEARIIGLSMYDQADRATAMIDAGAIGYQTKSGSPDVLLSAIRQADEPRVKGATA